MDRSRLLESGAYRLFLEELDKHLAFAASSIGGAGAVSQPIEGTVRSSLSAAFHTIRGGAGFFALNEISALSKELEERLALPVRAGTDDTSEVAELIARVRKLAAELPRP